MRYVDGTAHADGLGKEGDLVLAAEPIAQALALPVHCWALRLTLNTERGRLALASARVTPFCTAKPFGGGL